MTWCDGQPSRRVRAMWCSESVELARKYEHLGIREINLCDTFHHAASAQREWVDAVVDLLEWLNAD